VLFDGVVMPSPVPGSNGSCTLLSPIWDVSGYRKVVIHTPRCGITVQFRNGKAGFVDGAESLCPTNETYRLGRVLTVDPTMGREMRVSYHTVNEADSPDGPLTCSTVEDVALTVVAFKE
jgi:hypothetical protein